MKTTRKRVDALGVNQALLHAYLYTGNMQTGGESRVDDLVMWYCCFIVQSADCRQKRVVNLLAILSGRGV